MLKHKKLIEYLLNNNAFILTILYIFNQRNLIKLLNKYYYVLTKNILKIKRMEYY